MRNRLLTFLVLIGLFLAVSAGTNKLLMYSPENLAESEVSGELTRYYGDTCWVHSASGVLRIMGIQKSARIPFILNGDLPWEFVHTITPSRDITLFQTNPTIHWFYTDQENNEWMEIKSNWINLKKDRTYRFLFRYRPLRQSNSTEAIDPVFHSGFWSPLFYMITRPLRLILLDHDRIGQQFLFRLFITDSTLIGKTVILKALINQSSRTYFVQINNFEQILTIPIPQKSTLRMEKDGYQILIQLESNRESIPLFRKTLTIPDLQFHSGNFLLNQENFSFTAFYWVPTLSYAQLFYSPAMLNKIMATLRNQGFNSFILDVRHLSPLVLQLAATHHLFVIATARDSSAIRKNSLIGLNPSFLIPAVIVPPSFSSHQIHYERQFLLHQIYVRSSDFLTNQLYSNAIPFYVLENYSSNTLSKVAERVSTGGGFLGFSGVGYTLNDSIGYSFDPLSKYFEVINKIKSSSKKPVSGAFLWLHPFPNNKSLIFRHQRSFTTENPFVLLGNDGAIRTEWLPYSRALQSPFPVYPEFPPSDDPFQWLFITLSLANAILFLTFLKSYKPFQIYFLDALRRSRSFYLDLYEKIAIPWNETYWFNTFCGLGVAITLGVIFYANMPQLPLLLSVNLLFSHSFFTDLIFKGLNFPLILILLFFLAYWAGIILFSLLTKIIATIFRKSIRYRYAFAIISWAQIYHIIFVFIGLFAYKLTVHLNFSKEILYIMGIVALLSLFRIVTGLQITLGIMKKKIYLVLLILLAIISGTFYFIGFPIIEIAKELQHLFQVYY